MMKKIILPLLVFSVFSAYGQTSTDEEVQNECGQRLTTEEISKYMVNGFSGYTESDLDLLADITLFIEEVNPETTTCECFFNSRKKNFLVLDVFGVEEPENINKTMCALMENNEIKLPQITIVLFHAYINGFDDGGIISAFKMTK